MTPQPARRCSECPDPPGRCSPPGDAGDDRTAADHAADHAAIDRLTDDLLPALIAKLGATGLGELEVREGGWRVRLRRPAGNQAPKPARPASRSERKASDRGAANDPIAAGSASDRAARTLHRPLEAKTARTESRAVATSPAVGIYRPRPTSRPAPGSAPATGSVPWTSSASPRKSWRRSTGSSGSSLVESGDAVEYGQEILVIEFAPLTASTNGTGG